MQKLIFVVTLLILHVPALAAPSKNVKAVTCEGETGGAHTLIVGQCSFTGSPAKQVYAKCKEDSVCQVHAYGWNNGHGMYIITRVESVRLIETALTPKELEMARQCKEDKPCYLTCNRAHDAGREDLIRQGACAE